MKKYSGVIHNQFFKTVRVIIGQNITLHKKLHTFNEKYISLDKLYLQVLKRLETFIEH